jgi:hypothetical protein
MRTQDLLIYLKKDKDVVIIEKDNIKTDIAVTIESVGDDFLVEVPAFNITIFTKDKKNINESIKESIHSFFDYRLKKQGFDKFLGTMLQLGFSIKNQTSPIQTKKRKTFFNSIKTRQKESFSIA